MPFWFGLRLEVGWKEDERSKNACVRWKSVAIPRLVEDIFLRRILKIAYRIGNRELK